jgi:hypothetical protein
VEAPSLAKSAWPLSSVYSTTPSTCTHALNKALLTLAVQESLLSTFSASKADMRSMNETTMSSTAP